jgi:hypothetical protein
VQSQQTGQISPLGLGNQAKREQHEVLEVNHVGLERLEESLERPLYIGIEERVEELRYGASPSDVERSANAPSPEPIAILPRFVESLICPVVTIEDGYVVLLRQRPCQVPGVDLRAAETGGRKLVGYQGNSQVGRPLLSI